MNRETVASALYTRLQTIDGIKMFGRRPIPWDQIAPAERPALFLAVGDSENISPPGNFQRWRLSFIAYLYVWDEGADGPGVQLNDYLDKIDKALARSSSDKLGVGVETATTLGGAVHYAQITSVMTDEGSFQNFGVAIVTIETLAAG